MFYLFLLTSYTLSIFLIAFKTLFNCAILLTSSVNSVNTILSLDTFDDYFDDYYLDSETFDDFLGPKEPNGRELRLKNLKKTRGI